MTNNFILSRWLFSLDFYCGDFRPTQNWLFSPDAMWRFSPDPNKIKSKNVGEVITTGSFIYENGVPTGFLSKDDDNPYQNLRWVKVVYQGKTLLYCDRNISRVDIRRLDSRIRSSTGIVFTVDGLSFRLRLPSGGAVSPGTGSEWNAFVDACADDDDKMHIRNDPSNSMGASFCYEFLGTGSRTEALLRGLTSSPYAYFSSVNALHGSMDADTNGYRPVLELVE